MANLRLFWRAIYLSLSHTGLPGRGYNGRGAHAEPGSPYSQNWWVVVTLRTLLCRVASKFRVSSLGLSDRAHLECLPLARRPELTHLFWQIRVNTS
jgi:hypothetical protein